VAETARRDRLFVQAVELPVRGRERQLARRLEVTVDAVLGNRLADLAEVLLLEKLGEQNPPLRPEAAQPTVFASTRTTSSSGYRSRASSAVHSPVNPPPMTARSAVTSLASAGSGSGASGWSSQNERGTAPASDLATAASTGAGIMI